MKSTYDVRLTYQENYDNGPFFDGIFPHIPQNKEVSFLGKQLFSTIGVPAGPLINEKYTTLYARLGFDIVTYKTVRSQFTPCHPLPNCVFLPSDSMQPQDIGTAIHPIDESFLQDTVDITITNSFGVPSQTVEVWQEDMQRARNKIHDKQLLIGSALGTKDTPDEWITDIAYTSCLMKDVGIEVIELDLSCPNINKSKTGAGSVYLDRDFATAVVQKTKQEIGDTPLLIKVGYFNDISILHDVIDACVPYIQGIVGINTIRRKIIDTKGNQILPGEGRLFGGSCGKAIKQLAQDTVHEIIQYKNRQGYEVVVVGCGGVTSPTDFDEYYAMGCDAVMSATGAMWDPYLAYKWKTNNTTYIPF